MAVTAQDAQTYVDTDEDLTGYLATAGKLIAQYIGDVVVPDEVLDNATLHLVGELVMRRRSPGGIVNFGGDDTAIRLSRDPMSSVYPLLRPWVVPLP